MIIISTNVRQEILDMKVISTHADFLFTSQSLNYAEKLNNSWISLKKSELLGEDHCIKILFYSISMVPREVHQKDFQ